MLSTPGQLLKAGRTHTQVQSAGKDGLSGEELLSLKPLLLCWEFLPIKPQLHRIFERDPEGHPAFIL